MQDFGERRIGKYQFSRDPAICIGWRNFGNVDGRCFFIVRQLLIMFQYLRALNGRGDFNFATCQGSGHQFIISVCLYIELGS